MLLSTQVHAEAESFTEALTSGKFYANLNLRHESVDQDNALKDATALTLRTRVGYATGSYNGFSGLVEFEDSRIVAEQDNFSVPPTGFNSNPTRYSIIADPETTELDQAYIQYKNDLIKARYGSQVIVLDNQRYVGHVGWRQDRVTFDAVSAVFTPVDKLTITAAHLLERNRLFAEEADQKSKDNIINISYPTSIGKLTAYAYLLEDDFDNNAERDTYGIRLAGSQGIQGTKINYIAEYADQDLENDAGADFSMDYIHLELSANIKGFMPKIGMEKLGSDGGDQGFFTPLGTVHKFNGWADQFALGTPTEGLLDRYVGISKKIGPGKLSVIYHDFKADDESDTVDDLGNELNIAYGMKLSKNFNVAVKYADHNAGDTWSSTPVVGVDTEKLWVWIGFNM